MYPILHKTLINLENRDRKIDLMCIKWCLGSKITSASYYEIPREMNAVENWTQNLSFGHFNSPLFFLKFVTRRSLDHINSYYKFNTIIPN